LHDAHERLGARFTEVDGVLAPRDYGDPAAEHEAVRERAGLIDRSERGKIEVTGKDRATFLHGLVSSDVKGLVPGQGGLAALLDVHGKVTALLVVHCLADRLVLETDHRSAEPLLAAIDRYLFSERAGLEDVTPAWGILTVAGPAARKIVEQAIGAALPELSRWQHVGVPGEEAEARVVRTEETGEEGYDLWIRPEGLGRLWERLREAGARPGTCSGSRRASSGTASTWTPRRCSSRPRSRRPIRSARAATSARRSSRASPTAAT
jgi:glycine cleavage system aminomethyltransferase T